MKTIIIDDEPWMLRYFNDQCAGLSEIELVGSYRNPLTALEYAQNNTIDLAFIDMEMPQLNGAETAKRLGEISPGVKIVIISAFEKSYIESMLVCPIHGYLRKPYKKDDLQTMINRIITSESHRAV